MGQRGISRAGGVRSIDAVLGSRFLTAPFRRLTRGRLRILGYHGVADPIVFASQMQHLVDNYDPVTPEQLIAAWNGGTIPPRAVWVTFDDADPTVIDHALPVLRRLAIPATLFVCPGVVGTDTPYWWQVVEDYENTADVEAVGGRPATGWLAYLKSTGDEERRRVVDAMSQSLTLSLGSRPKRRQITVEELEEFITHGSLGNHTWDHPCLDRCSEEEQTRQITKAHDWLQEKFGTTTLFAYPNGNHSNASQRVLEDLGYDMAVLFDHRLAAHAQNPLRLSRIRTSDTATPARYAALTSGVHSTVHRVRNLLV